MKLTVTATDRLTEIDGVRCRVWEGLSEDGVPCTVLIHRIAVHREQGHTRFARELREMPQPHFVPLGDVLP